MPGTTGTLSVSPTAILTLTFMSKGEQWEKLTHYRSGYTAQTPLFSTACSLCMTE